MICLLCKEEKKLVKAHIIPEGFFRRMREGGSHLLVLNQVPGKILPKRSPIGVYDKELVCRDCESIWNDWDTHAQEILSHDMKLAKPIRRSGQDMAWRIDHFDYMKLKLFFISVLWKAAVSRQTFYRKVDIGIFESIARKMILERNPGQTDEFGVVITRFMPHKFDIVMFDPFREKINHVNFYRFYMAGYVVYMKVDRRPMPPPWSRLAIREGESMYVVRRDMDKSPELPLILNFARQ